MIMKSTNGFSYIEVIIVISLIAVLGMMGVPFASNFTSNINMSVTRDQFISYLRKAQHYSINGKSGSVWGVCITGAKLRLYKDICEGSDFQEEFEIPANVEIEGFTNITFSKLRGEPDNTFDATLSVNNKTIYITLNAVGGLDY